jgi:hypothetical protein
MLPAPKGAAGHPSREPKHRHLFRLYDASPPSTSNSYAAPFIFGATIGPQRAGASEIPCHFGAIMKDHSQSKNADPYSPLMCIVLLLMVGAAAQLKVHAIWF